MPQSKVTFLHGLRPGTMELVASYAPADFTILPVETAAPEREQVEAVRDADFLMIYRAEPSDAVLEAATRTRLIQLLAAGYEKMNLGLLRRMGIPCAHNAGANSEAVADHALLLMLALYRRLIPSDRATRQGKWRAEITGLNTFEMAGKLLGVVGFGAIGRKVARRARAFGASVQYYDKYPISPEQEAQEGVRRASLEELFPTSDIITCHTPLTEETRGMVNRRSLASMKPSAILINTSRGEVIDEEALVEALQQGKIAGAGLDVFQQEPVDPAHPLLRMDNVVVSPHTAGTTLDTWRRRADFAYGNMRRVLQGEPPLGLVG